MLVNTGPDLCTFSPLLYLMVSKLLSPRLLGTGISDDIFSYNPLIYTDM